MNGLQIVQGIGAETAVVTNGSSMTDTCGGVAAGTDTCGTGIPQESAHVLVIDNYDSFVYTIVGYLRTLGATVTVVRNDAVDPVGNPDLLTQYDGVLVSPGPGTPADAGASENVIRLCAKTHTPMLGVCLGLQALAEVYGATVSHAPTIRHGKTSSIQIVEDLPFEEGRAVDGTEQDSASCSSLFVGVPNPLTATRYHSLAVEPETLPSALCVIARALDDGTVQGIQHVSLPLYAVQFHPESVMSQSGYRIFANWLAVCGQASAVGRSEGLTPKVVGDVAGFKSND